MRTRRAIAGTDVGFSLAEVMVAMALLSLVGMLATAGLVRMYATAGRSESAASAQAQLLIAVQRLQREVRYASGVSAPRQAGDWYVEFMTVRYAGPPECVQVRLLVGPKRLERRTWLRGAVPAGGWGVLASEVAAGGAAPFTLIAAGERGSGHQRLSIDLTVAAGTSAERRAALTLVALNTSPDTARDVCTEGRGAP
jgi:prepilin-type N-terminal cleavage/methylation domain-containing protein